MSYRSRERRRRKNAAQAAAQRAVRSASAAGAVGRWYLTICTRATCCARCARPLREGQDMVYRATPRESRCVECAQVDPEVSYRPSLAWEAARRKRSGRGARIAV